jgi:acyl-CoA thioester hydrolase
MEKMRIDRPRMESARFPYSVEVATRFSDLDLLGHVNNVAVTDLLQEGRNRFIKSLELDLGLQRSVVVASLHVEFASDLFHPAPVQMRVGILEVGRTSFRVGQLVKQGEKTAVYAEVVQVATGPQGAAPLPEQWRARLESAMVAFA